MTVISLEEYSKLISIQEKEEMQIVLPSRDIFSDELRLLISNSKCVTILMACLVEGSGQGAFAIRRCAEIRIYSGSENVELMKQVLWDEYIVMHSLCSAFYILYTSRGQLHIYSTRTNQVVRNLYSKISPVDQERTHH